MSEVVEYIGTTGEIIRRSLTPDEAKRREADERAAAELEQHFADIRDAFVDIRADAIAHAKTLGFTDEMIAVMYPRLIAE